MRLRLPAGGLSRLRGPSWRLPQQRGGWQPPPRGRFANFGSLHQVRVVPLVPHCRLCATATGAADNAKPGQAEPEVVEPPTKGQLRMQFIASAVPFVGFGFMDNFVMICAGDIIDSTLCVTFCFSTMAAAALGNTMSDVVGIYTGSMIEQVAERFGIKEPPLSPEQRLLGSTKIWLYAGQIIGIVTGCFLGMVPLLFLDLNESTRLKREKELQTMLADAMPEAQRILKAEGLIMMEIDEEKEVMRCLSKTDNITNPLPISMKSGVMGHVAETKRFVNIADVRETSFYTAELHEDFLGSHIRIQSVLSVPVLRGDKVVGVLSAFNKEEGNTFTERDEDTLCFIASHMSVRMETVLDVQQSFKDVVMTCEQVLAKRESTEYGSHTARQRRAELYLPALNGISMLLQAQAAVLMLLDETNEELYTEAIVGEFPKHKNKLGQGLAGKCAVQGRAINVSRNASEDDGQASFDKERHENYLGSGTSVRSELCVPMFNSDRKCLGVIKVINKQNADSFDDNDVNFATEVANNLAIMLEDNGGVKRVLAQTRMQLQQKAATSGERADHNTVLCYLDRGQDLPNDADTWGVGIDPYVTVHIVRYDPLEALDTEAVVRQARLRDKTEVARRFGRSKIIEQSLSPHWDETIAVTVPLELRGVPREELYAHVLLWDYDRWKNDDLVAQAAIPLAEMPRGKLSAVSPVHLQPIVGNETHELGGSRLWLSFTVAGQKPLAPSLSPPNLNNKLERRRPEDFAGDTYAPKFGKAAVDAFQASDDWLSIVESVKTSLTSTCGVSFGELERTRREADGRNVVCAVSDPEKLDCPLVYVSKGFEDLTGYPRSYALGRNCRFLQPNNRTENDASNLADRDRMRNFCKGFMPEGHVLWNLLLNESFDGRQFWNLLRMEFVHLGEARKPYIFAVQREFTKQPSSLQEVEQMRALLVGHEKNGTVPVDVLAWAGLEARSRSVDQ